jgi:hypothetical protein
METTFTLARNFSVTPFAIFEQDCDEVISVINHYIKKANASPEKSCKDKNQRIRVNDKTASGGWW